MWQLLEIHWRYCQLPVYCLGAGTLAIPRGSDLARSIRSEFRINVLLMQVGWELIHHAAAPCPLTDGTLTAVLPGAC